MMFVLGLLSTQLVASETDHTLLLQNKKIGKHADSGWHGEVDSHRRSLNLHDEKDVQISTIASGETVRDAVRGKSMENNADPDAFGEETGGTGVADWKSCTAEDGCSNEGSKCYETVPGSQVCLPACPLEGKDWSCEVIWQAKDKQNSKNIKKSVPKQCFQCIHQFIDLGGCKSIEHITADMLPGCNHCAKFRDLICIHDLHPSVGQWMNSKLDSVVNEFKDEMPPQSSPPLSTQEPCTADSSRCFQEFIDLGGCTGDTEHVTARMVPGCNTCAKFANMICIHDLHPSASENIYETLDSVLNEFNNDLAPRLSDEMPPQR